MMHGQTKKQVYFGSLHTVKTTWRPDYLSWI